MPLFDQSDRRHIGIPDPNRTPAAEEEILHRTPIFHHKKFSTEEIIFPQLWYINFNVIKLLWNLVPPYELKYLENRRDQANYCIHWVNNGIRHFESCVITNKTIF